MSIALIALLGLELLVGGFLSTQYSAANAYSSTQNLHKIALLQAFHYWGSAVLILGSLGQLSTMTWLGWYRQPFTGRYLSILITFLCGLGFQITGNILPFDRHGIQTASIEAGIAARVPVVGSTVSHIILGGNEAGPQTVPHWYFAHLGLTLLAIGAIALAVREHRRHEAKLLPALAALPGLLAIVLAFAISSPLGSVATPADYGQYHALVSWYTWPMHGMMSMFEKIIPGSGWIGSAIVPGLFVGFLAALALFGSKVGAKAARATFAGFGLLFAVATIGFGGSFAKLTGTRDPEDTPVATTNQTVTPIDATLVAKGKQLINQLDCVNCHGKDGIEPKGGPSLKDVYKKHPDADYFMRYIKQPTSVSPNSTMPAFDKLEADKLRAIAEYLRSPH